MEAKGITQEQLEQAAHTVGIRVECSHLNQKGTRHRVKAYPVVPRSAWQIAPNRKRKCPICGESVHIVGETSEGGKIGACGDAATPERWANGRRWVDERGDSPYQRTSAAVMFREGRRVHAVCWHGFRDYFRACFRLAPDAVFRTALDTWKGTEDFEARYRESGHKNIGAPIAPVCMAEACRCGEEGYAG